MPTDPYRARPRPERPSAPPSTPSAMAVAGAFVWLATVLRIALSFVRAERPSRELVFAWIVLIVVPALAAREVARDDQAG